MPDAWGKLLKKIFLTLAVIAFVLSATVLTPVYASQLGLEKDHALEYKYVRMSTQSQAQQTGDLLLRVLTFDQDTLTFQISPSSQNDPSTSFNYLISYRNGIPVYVDRLETLIYLPYECLNQSLTGNLDWTSHIETSTWANVTNATSGTLDFTLEAGTFHSINITLSLAGDYFGALSLVYDLESGILIYEQWVPSYGDIIIQFLANTASIEASQLTIQSFVLPTVAIGIPVALILLQTRRRIQMRRGKIQEASVGTFALKSGFSKIPFSLAMVGALLTLVAVFLPWSQALGSTVYLPLSLPSALTQSVWSAPATFTFTMISVAVHIAAIIAWLSIALYLHANKKLLPQIVAVASSVLGFASAAIFIQTASALAWGLIVLVIGSVLTVASLAAAHIHITFEVEPEETQKPEEQEKPEDHEEEET
jgi:hypothetical protein